MDRPRWWKSDFGVIGQAGAPITPEDQFDHLPRLFAGGTRVLAFDGRLDNRSDLIRDLGLPPHGDPIPDGALVARALEQWGDDAPCYLLGDFAFAAWEPQGRRLLLACDQTGRRSVYYAIGEDGITFASAISLLRGMPGLPKAVDPQALANFLVKTGPTPGRTFFQGVNCLPNATRLIWVPGAEPRLDSYWRPQCRPILRLRNDEDYVEAARELLDRAVGANLRVLGPIVCQMSGGLDSPGVAATAARLAAPATVHTLTATPNPEAGALPEREGFFTDEWSHARAVAAMYPNMVAHGCPADGREIDHRRALLYSGHPLSRADLMGWFAPMEAKARELGARAVLGGAMGNLILTWTGTNYLSDLLASGRLVKFATEFRAFSRESGQTPLQVLKSDVLRPMLPHGLWLARRRRQTGQPWTWMGPTPLRPDSPYWQEALDTTERVRAANGGEGRSDRLRLGYMQLMLQVQHMMQSQRLYKGYESRDPYCYLPLVEFCLSLPADQFVRKGVSRFLARRVLADRLPSQVIDERRRGRLVPEWHQRFKAQRDRIASELEGFERSALVLEMLDVSLMRSTFDAMSGSQQDAEARYHDFIHILEFGLSVGRFIRWVEGAND